MINDDFVKYEDDKRDEYIRLDTTIIGIDNLIAKASTAEEANALFKAKDVIYSQQQTEQKVLDVVSNEKYVELKDGLKKFRSKKFRSGNFVVYDINYLLENLAREIFMLYQAKSDFDKPLLDLDEIRRMFVDYAPCEKCTNPDAYGTICVKCGACGRKFDKEGRLIVDE